MSVRWLLAAALAAGLLSASGSGAAAADKAGCKAPSWAQQRLPGYDIDDCEERTWATFDASLPKGNTRLFGHRSVVRFTLADQGKNKSAAAARAFYLQQGQKAGGKLASDPSNGWIAYLTAKSKQGEIWFIYEHGNGNGDSTGTYALTTMQIAPIPREVQAQPMKVAFDPLAPCANPPWITKAPSHFKIDSCDARLWDATPVNIANGSKTVEGPYQTVSYKLDDDRNGKPAMAVQADITAALKQAGLAVVSDPKNIDQVVATQKTPKGEFWFAYQHYGSDDTTGAFTLTTFQVTPDPQFVQVQPMKGVLDTESAQCADPGWLVKQFPQYKRTSCDNLKRDAVNVDLAGGKPKTLAGARMSTTYEIADDKKVETDIGIQRNFNQAFKAIGAKIVSDPGNVDQVVATQKLPQGEFWYIYQAGGGNSSSRGSFTLTTVQITAFDQQVQVQPMKAPLDTLAKCSDPSWLFRQFPQYKISGCDNRIWDIVPIDLPGGHKDLTGARTRVTYAIADDKKVETSLTVQKNYVLAFKAIGLPLLSDPNNIDEAMMSQTTPQGEFWFIYQAGGGNSEARSTYDLTTVQITPFPQVVQVQLMKSGLEPQPKGCQSPTWLVKQFEYFAIGQCSYRDFDSITIDMPDGSKKTLAGRILTTDYTLGDQTRVPTGLYVYKNYVDALEGIGAKLLTDPKDNGRAILTQTTPQGEFWYLYSRSSGNDESVGSYELTSIQIGGPPPKTCTLEVYGVNFDFNKSTLRPDSEPVLNQLLAFFNADPSYSAEVGGHTDNVGTESYNLKLSGARAAAVKAWLVAHGVAANRLTTQGYGFSRPLVPNTTDENRAKNRRVELKRANCK